jgi:hypothetical protein
MRALMCSLVGALLSWSDAPASSFFFETKEDKDLIFRSGPYFYGTKGLYANRWNPNFNPKNSIPSVVHVWVRLPHLPPHYWNKDIMRSIRNALRTCIYNIEPRYGTFACICICVEVDLEKGLLEAIQLTLDNSKHIQLVEYDHIPFKCKQFHGYGNFVKNFPKNATINKDLKTKMRNGNK